MTRDMFMFYDILDKSKWPLTIGALLGQFISLKIGLIKTAEVIPNIIFTLSAGFLTLSLASISAILILTKNSYKQKK